MSGDQLLLDTVCSNMRGPLFAYPLGTGVVSLHSVTLHDVLLSHHHAATQTEVQCKGINALLPHMPGMIMSVILSKPQ